MRRDEHGQLVHSGVYVGDDLETYLMDARRSGSQNVAAFEKPVTKVIAMMQADEFRTMRAANKAVYRTRMAVAMGRASCNCVIIPPSEIVSAEVKLDTAGLITAFGQACADKLFSHRSYLVVPAESSEEDIARLDALGRIFGIELILFDSARPAQPDFEIRVRASRHELDMFYVNKYLKLIEDELFS